MSRVSRSPSDLPPADDSSDHLDGLIDEEDEDFASAYASDPSFPRSSFQAAKGGASVPRIRPRIQGPEALVPGRTPIPTRPFILRSIPKHTSTPLAQEQTSQLLRSLSQRDRCILQSL